MAKFQKRPVIIEAVQWTGDNESELQEFVGADLPGVKFQPDGLPGDPEVTAFVWDYLHSTWVGVKTGQWVIQGVKGEFYPIDPQVLAETYVPVD